MNTAQGVVPDGPLWTVPVLGGSPRRLVKLEGHSAACLPDGKRIAYSKGNEIFLAKSDGSEPLRLLITAGMSDDLRWSPDGTILRFTANDPQTNNRSIWQASSDGGNIGDPVPSRDGKEDPPRACAVDDWPDVIQRTPYPTGNKWGERRDSNPRHPDPQSKSSY